MTQQPYKQATTSKRNRLFWIFLCTSLVVSFVEVSAQDDETSTTCSAQDSDGTCVNAHVVPIDTMDEDMMMPWGATQDLSDPQAQQFFDSVVQPYMKNVVWGDALYDSVKERAIFSHTMCTYWATQGECDANPRYMKQSCCPACQSCDMLDWKLRCPFDTHELFWNTSGKVNALFERLETEYQATVLSRNPWIVTIDDFLSKVEAERLIELGGIRGYERSMDAGEIQEDGKMASVLSQDRTSSNAWCLDDCFRDDVTQTVLERLESMLEIPRIHYEYFQLLKYEPGEFYREHNDYNPTELHRPQGNRILTAYAYLCDVPSGGGTKFPALGLEVSPKQGRLVIWPSVLNSNPKAKDRMTNHEALPVLEGTKYGANIWVHQRNFVEALAKDCV